VAFLEALCRRAGLKGATLYFFADNVWNKAIDMARVRRMTPEHATNVLFTLHGATTPQNSPQQSMGHGLDGTPAKGEAKGDERSDLKRSGDAAEPPSGDPPILLVTINGFQGMSAAIPLGTVLTVITGPNSSGKSRLLRALTVLGLALRHGSLNQSKDLAHNFGELLFTESAGKYQPIEFMLSLQVHRGAISLSCAAIPACVCFPSVCRLRLPTAPAPAVLLPSRVRRPRLSRKQSPRRLVSQRKHLPALALAPPPLLLALLIQLTRPPILLKPLLRLSRAKALLLVLGR
jgi:hypothetical protein